jgi:hypothetical protein
MKDAFGIISAVAITAAAFAVLVSATAHMVRHPRRACPDR